PTPIVGHTLQGFALPSRRLTRRSPAGASLGPVDCAVRRRRFASSLWLQRIGPDDLPAVTLALLGLLALVHRCSGALRALLLLEQPARSGRGVEEHRPRRLCAAVLPGMLDAARHDGAGAGTTDGDLVA